MHPNMGPGNGISICAVKAQTEEDSTDNYPKITDHFSCVAASPKKKKKLSKRPNYEEGKPFVIPEEGRIAGSILNKPHVKQEGRVNVQVKEKGKKEAKGVEEQQTSNLKTTANLLGSNGQEEEWTAVVEPSSLPEEKMDASCGATNHSLRFAAPTNFAEHPVCPTGPRPLPPMLPQDVSKQSGRYGHVVP